MEELSIKLGEVDFKKAEAFSTFRENCKVYLTSVNKNWDKFTVVSHDSFIGYLTEMAIKQHLLAKYPEIKIESWEDQFDMKALIKIIKENKTDAESIDLVVKYFYDKWDLKILNNSIKILSDVKTALTEKEPNDNWNFLYPVIQASKEGKDLMILVYYVVNTIKDLRTFSKLILVGAITPEIIKTCDIIKAGEKTKFGTISQIDNYITKLNKNYKPIESFINI